jgi:hypothetical protein
MTSAVMSFLVDLGRSLGRQSRRRNSSAHTASACEGCPVWLHSTTDTKVSWAGAYLAGINTFKSIVDHGMEALTMGCESIWIDHKSCRGRCAGRAPCESTPCVLNWEGFLPGKKMTAFRTCIWEESNNPGRPGGLGEVRFDTIKRLTREVRGGLSD